MSKRSIGEFSTWGFVVGVFLCGALALAMYRSVPFRSERPISTAQLANEIATVRERVALVESTQAELSKKVECVQDSRSRRLTLPSASHKK